MVAAQMIRAGKLPYIDFCFPQTPLNAFWNGGWMWMFGLSWRLAHAWASILTSVAVLLVADFVFTRMKDSRWRLPCALSAGLLVALNPAVFEYGPVGQAYGMCLCLSVGAFRLAVRAVERDSLLACAGAGLLALAAAESSLLTAPVTPFLLIWILVCANPGSRLRQLGAFLSGGVIALIPLIWLFAKAPRLVFFNLVEYQLVYRTVNWPGATEQNLQAMIAWIDSPAAFLLLLLATGGFIVVRKHRELDAELRRILYLCFWLSVALLLHISTAHPTFQRYYLLAVPFLGILAAAGFYAAGLRLVPHHPWRLAAVVIAMLVLGRAKFVYDDRDSMHWSNLEAIARKVAEVTPPGALFLADEHIYFVNRVLPPSGEELKDSHKLGLLPPGLAAALHVVPQAELDRQIKAGVFRTVEDCDDDEKQNRALNMPGVFSETVAIETCHVSWNKK
jgi:hypothetical protein